CRSPSRRLANKRIKVTSPTRSGGARCVCRTHCLIRPVRGRANLRYPHPSILRRRPMFVPGYRDHPTESWDPDTPADPAEAEDFLRRCYTENPRLGPVEPRLAIVRAQIAATGTYVHTPDELTHGARMAWRNASRCIGRLYWRSLLVLDRRRARTADEIYSLLVQHLQVAGEGQLRAVISVFAAAQPGQPYARVWNEQLIR